MKTIVLHGSPHLHGNSATLAEYFLNGLNEKGAEHFYINEMQIRPCQGCEKCATRLENHCAIEDDMQKIYSAFIAADIIVFATPMYWGYMTAQMKTVMDRMEAITQYFRGKKFVVLITYRHHCESTVAFFKRVCPFFEVHLHTLVCRTMDEQEHDIPITSLPDKLQEAFELGRKLSAA
ncbi:MAG: flavodoxin family protein [Anaerolineales bacterium]|nr:flavodoxin family protein [Anaerolineales bacterium]